MTNETSPQGIATTSDAAVGAAGTDQLSMPVIWAFSMPRIGFGIMGLLFGTYLMKFSTDVLLIAPAVMGSLIAGSRLWDAFSDPLAGYLSDRTISKHGRRRVWMFYAAIPMGIGLVMIWSPPTMLGDIGMIIWMGIALLVYETASTAFFVPHGAIGVELTPNYHERTRLYGYAHMIGAIGSILGLISLQFMNMSDDKRTFAFFLSLLSGFTVTAIVLWSTRILPERRDYQGRGSSSIVKSILDVFKNKHALLLLIVYAIETFGAASVGMLVPYLVEYVLPLQSMMVPILLAYTIPQFIFTPMWMRLAKIFGKKPLWAFAMWLNAAVFFSFFFVLTPGETSIWIWVLAFSLGFAAGCGAVVAPSIQADIIDYDEYLTSERKEGAYLAVWNLVRKSAASMAALITGMVLQYTGFEPNVEQSTRTMNAILALFALLPGICYVVGALLFFRFDFNEDEHAEVRQILAERSSQNQS